MTDFIKSLTKTDTRSILAFVATFGIFSFIGLLFVVKVPSENIQTLNTLLPMVFTIVGTCFGYYYGSSKRNAQNKEEE